MKCELTLIGFYSTFRFVPYCMNEMDTLYHICDLWAKKYFEKINIRPIETQTSHRAFASG